MRTRQALVSMVSVFLIVGLLLGCASSANAADSYLEATTYIDYNTPEIQNLAQSLVTADMSDREKMESIYTWVTSNIAYDYDAYLRKEVQLVKASQVLKDKVGLCRDYSFLFAALARSAGLPTKVVYGDATSGKSTIYHAWNEVKIDGTWMAIDSCWDAGYVNKTGFVQRANTKYLGGRTISSTHKITKTTDF